MLNHGTLGGVQWRGIHAGRRGTHQSIGATAPPPHRGVRQAAGGGEGAHVVRRSWWVCCGALRRVCGAVVGG
ncbi:hypothetical protein DD630_22600 [Streptomyces sp. BSE7F]|nr:hypothetical protein DD630_22600 [Streptomyces sp. BSE7F]